MTNPAGTGKAVIFRSRPALGYEMPTSIWRHER
jgi:hypothetical protein